MTEQTNGRRGRKWWIVGGLGLAAVAFGAGAVSAQFGGPGFGPRGWHHGHGMGPDRAARFARFCGDDQERYHTVVRALVKADLRLNAGQQAEFDKIVDSLLPLLQDVKREACNNFTAQAGPAPEKLAHLAAVLRKAADAAEKMVEPTRQFYGNLDATQKARVDEVAARRRGPMGPMEYGPGMRRWQ